MKCECFNRVNANLREKLGAAGSLKAMIQFGDGKLVTRPSVTFVYHKNNKDGSRQQKESEIEVSYGYCPFCGTAYGFDKVEEE